MLIHLLPGPVDRPQYKHATSGYPLAMGESVRLSELERQRVYRYLQPMSRPTARTPGHFETVSRCRSSSATPSAAQCPARRPISSERSELAEPSRPRLYTP